MEIPYYWRICPRCGNPKMVKLRADTSAVNFPAYCKRCKKESIISIAPMSHISES